MEALQEAEYEFKNVQPTLRYRNGEIVEPIKEWFDPSIVLRHYRLIEGLKNSYVLDNSQEIEDFLLANGDLTEILFNGVPYITQIFGDSLKHLDYYEDLDEGTEKLAIIIQSPFKTEENIRRQNELVTGWFAGLPPSIRTKLSIETEPPSVWNV
jgi:hypothetical protein